MRMHWIAVTAALLVGSEAQAAKFANQFTEFELPPQWQCNLEGAEWVCQATEEAKKRDAIIVLAAKLKNEQDSLDQYLAYLKGPKNFTSVQGKTMSSQPKYAKNIEINSHPWVDSLHLESEIPGFYTRYLATVKADIGVLVTYSINKDKYQNYVQVFENLVKTLKVFRKPGGLSGLPTQTSLFEGITIPQNISQGTFLPGGNPPQGGSDSPQKVAKPEEDDSLFYLIIGAAVIGFIIWRRRQRG